MSAIHREKTGYENERITQQKQGRHESEAAMRGGEGSKVTEACWFHIRQLISTRSRQGPSHNESERANNEPNPAREPGRARATDDGVGGGGDFAAAVEGCHADAQPQDARQHHRPQRTRPETSLLAPTRPSAWRPHVAGCSQTMQSLLTRPSPSPVQRITSSHSFPAAKFPRKDARFWVAFGLGDGELREKDGARTHRGEGGGGAYGLRVYNFGEEGETRPSFGEWLRFPSQRGTTGGGGAW
eukprot:2592048-Rhodomonas_salina.7